MRSSLQIRNSLRLSGFIVLLALLILSPVVAGARSAPRGEVAAYAQANDSAPTVSDLSAFTSHVATVGKPFILTLPAADAGSGNGGPYEYILRLKGANVGLQGINGLSFNPRTRVLSGTPLQARAYELDYVVHDADGNRDITDAFRENTNLRLTATKVTTQLKKGANVPDEGGCSWDEQHHLSHEGGREKSRRHDYVHI